MRIPLVEYSAGVPLDALAQDQAEAGALYRRVQQANERISSQLRLSRDVLQISNGRLRALGIAGVIQLSRGLELEIIPKFLQNAADTEWKPTLYLLSALSKHGSILPSEQVAASSSYLHSLYEIAGRILAQEYLRCRRKPVRTYRKERFWEYAIDGDPELSALFERHPDGMEQSRIRFDRYNSYNATIREAMRIVQPFTMEARVKNILSTAVSEWGCQGPPPKQKQPLSARNREWQPAYDLSYDIVRGLGASYHAGKLIAPGFVVDTWRLWEWLITAGIQTGIKTHKVLPQNALRWGEKKTAEGQSAVNVFPDIEVASQGGHPAPLYLIDAKYKRIAATPVGEIDRADLYEAFAFCSAAAVKEIVLVYPDEAPSETPGLVKPLSTYFIKDVLVHAVQVSFGSMREKGGILSFAANLTSGIEGVLQQAPSPSQPPLIQAPGPAVPAAPGSAQ